MATAPRRSTAPAPGRWFARFGVARRHRARWRSARLGAAALLLSGCTALVVIDLDERYGTARVRARAVGADSAWGVRYREQIRPIIDKRCVVCHGCYDAPCQLLLTSNQGIDRGASKEPVYHGTRLIQAEPTRLVDATSTADWRRRAFHPVLNERDPSGIANTQASVFYRTLDLKRSHPLPDQELLPPSFTLDLDRRQECSTIEEFDRFAQNQPLWGMPYALPAVTAAEYSALSEWLAAGAPLPRPTALPPEYQQRIARWEAFLNQDSVKARLVSRYIFEHLFLGHIYFDDLPLTHFFALVRSATPPGEAIKLIATRRPYDDPGVERVYYRLRPVDDSLLSKTHMAYAFGERRMQQWRRWFFDTPYVVTALPSYEPKIASNPFLTFERLPASSRYRFMLEEAHFTIEGFIKGPVCRGQVALNVINDRFWVFFFKTGLAGPIEGERFLSHESSKLSLPAASANSVVPLGPWRLYSANQKEYLKAKAAEANRIFATEKKLSLDIVWDGDGYNPSAALTVFRHFDSATVVQGLVGKPPKTAWVIDYPILERIHYLLVAGFDVYGNLGHHLLTRLYMDFLRMEGEFNFLMFLPRTEHEKEWDIWYDGAPTDVRDYVKESRDYFLHQTDIVYATASPKQELYGLLRQKLSPILADTHSLLRHDVPPNHRRSLERLADVSGKPAALLPQIVLLTVHDKSGSAHLYSVLHNNAHSNISSLLREETNRRPEQDDLTVVRGALGAYPSAFWSVHEDALPRLVDRVATLQSEHDYAALMREFGVRRTDKRFWAHSDQVHALYQKASPLTYGLLDFSRLENR
jgi:hypothetical protein